MKVHLLYRDRDLDVTQPLPRHAADLIQDLELETVLNAMARGDRFVFETARRVILSSLVSDLETVRYRQAVLEDCLRQPALIRTLYQLTIEAQESERKASFIFFKDPSLILMRSVQILELLFAVLRKLRAIADEQTETFCSEGLRELCAMLQRELSDDYLARIEEHLRELHFRDGVLLSARLGQGNKGRDYTLRRAAAPQGPWFSRLLSRGKRAPGYTFRIPERDEAGARALSELRNRGLNLVANALARSTEHILSFFALLRRELAFYVGCLNLAEELAGRKLPFCFPTVAPTEEQRRTFEGLYDPALALTQRTAIVGNDGHADGKRLILITGANRGGKSTFLRSLGLAQLLLQSGMFVPARAFHASLCNGLFTHFRRREDATLKSGKLDEELNRMSAIVDDIRPHALLLLNESFAATNEHEGSELAHQIITALVAHGITVCYVTHLATLARRFAQEHRPEMLFLRAERLADGRRTFRLVEGEPEETGYARDLYARVFASDLEIEAKPG
ncbi:MutS-related protein [Thermogemmatispora tikiterensis]|uniref:DNA mismatch repair protein MutS n=1 Tax=Thermogemmatispora tikiterensis TaxID=1825093 RepID=A0A328VMG2_9CHLR|nr:DNA mismatch repair protein MutS [Thermogemmatispora tikiterensis]RAQ98439.1 DNA mismatch repair protein MutS [Thermogemmatispora tikiterensis]